MIYVVLDHQIVGFPDATGGRVSGNGQAIHILEESLVEGQGEVRTIVGSFPMKRVKYFGEKLPPIWEEQYQEQVRWANLTPAEREAEKEAKRKEKEGQG